MSPEEQKASEIDATLKAEQRRRADAEDGQAEKLDKLLTHLDSLGRRMDAMEEEEEEKSRADKKKRMRGGRGDDDD
jgi:hypothetical protein